MKTIKGTLKNDFKGKIMTVLHNNEPSPFYGDRFGQTVEPAGFYCTQKESNLIPKGWTQHALKLDNPKLIDVSKDLVKWKFSLSKKMGNSKGKALSKKLQKAGFDGIITVYRTGKYKGYTGEIIVFDPKKSLQ